MKFTFLVLMSVIGLLPYSTLGENASNKTVKRVSYSASVRTSDNTPVNISASIQLSKEMSQLEVRWFRATSENGKFEEIDHTTQSAAKAASSSSRSSALERYEQQLRDLETHRMPESMKAHRREHIQRMIDSIKKRGSETKNNSNVKKIPSASFKLVDENAVAQGKNYLYYKMVLYNEITPIFTGSVLKIPVAVSPVFEGTKWSWSPIDTTGEVISGIITEEASRTIVAVKMMDKILSGDVTSHTAAKPISLKMTYTGKKRISFSNDEVLNINLYLGSTSRGSVRSSKTSHTKFDMNGHGSQGNMNIRLSANDYNDKVKIVSIKNKRTNRNIALEKASGTSRGRGTGSSSVKLQAGGEYIFNCDYYDRETDKLYKADLNYYSLPVFNCKIVSTSQGVIIDWSKFLKQCNLKRFAVTPMLKISRNISVPVPGSKTAFSSYQGVNEIVPLSQGRFIDNAHSIKKGEQCHYEIKFVDNFLKQEMYVVGSGVQDYYEKLPFSSGIDELVTSRYDVKKGKNRINYVTLNNQPRSTQEPNLELATELPGNPLKVGLWKPEMFHRNTGELGNGLYIRTVKYLEKEANIKLYDREHTADLLKEMKLIIPPDKLKVYSQEPLDFIIRVCDFSHAAGNGVELWLTKVDLNDDDPNYNNTWRIARIDDGQKVDYSKVRIDLLKKLKELADFDASAKGKNTKTPRNFVFDFLRPVEQAPQVTEYREITESLLLAASNKLPKRNLFSRSDWNLILQERLAMDAHGMKPFEDVQGDVLVAGRIWKDKSKFKYYFKAIDMLSGEHLSSLYTYGSSSQISTKIGKWLSLIRINAEFVPSIGRGAEDYRYFENKLYPFRGDQDWVGYTYQIDELLKPQRYSIPNISGSDIGAKFDYARKLFDIGSRQRAIDYLKNEWERKYEKQVGLHLAGYYHKMGLYILEANLYDQIIEKHGKKSVRSTTLNKIRSLAKNRGNVIKSFTRKAKNRPDHRTFLEKLKEENTKLNIIGASDLINDKAQQEQIYISRPQAGYEWNYYNSCNLNRWFAFVDSEEHFFDICKKLDGVPGQYRISYERVAKGKNEFKINYVKGTILMRRPKSLKELIRMFGLEAVQKQDLSENIQLDEEYKSGVLSEFLSYRSWKEEAEFIDYFEEDSKRSPHWSSYRELQIIDIIAEKGNRKAKKIIKDIIETPLPDFYGDWDKDKIPFTDHASIFFRALKRDKKATEYYLKYGKEYGRNHFRADDQIIYSFAKAGLKEPLAVALLSADEYKHHSTIIRCGEKNKMVELLTQHPELYQKDPGGYSYLLDGYRMKNMTGALLEQVENGSYESKPLRKAIVLLNGTPIEVVREEALEVEQ